MSRIKYALCLAGFLCTLTGIAVGQTYNPFAPGLTAENVPPEFRKVKIGDFAIHPVTDDLYFTGNFNHVDGIEFRHIAVWDGNNLDSIGQLPEQVSVLDIEFYDGDLHAFVGFGFGDSLRLMKWDGTVWDTLRSYSIDESTSLLKVRDNKLYVATTGQIDILDGSTWSGIDVAMGQNMAISDFELYQGDLYVSGLNIPAGFENTLLAKWNGNAFESVTGLPGVTFNMDLWEGKLAIHNSQLYYAGGIEFWESTDTAAPSFSGLGRFDGTSWSHADATSADIRFMRSLQGDLYCRGTVLPADNPREIEGIAAWTGTRWCGYDIEDWGNDDVPKTFVEYDNALILPLNTAGHEGDSFINAVQILDYENHSICAWATSYKDPNDVPIFRVFPNPTYDWVTIEFDVEDAAPATLRICNMAGATMLEDQKSAGANARLTLDVAHLPAGLYLLTVTSANGTWQQKLIKH